MIRTVYSLTQEDFYEANVKHAGAWTKIEQGFGIFLACVGIASIAYREYTQVIFIIVGAFLFFRFRLSVRSSFKKNFAGQPATTAVVSDTGIEFNTAKGITSLNWTAFVRFVETNNLLLLYVQSNCFNPIPKRALTPEDLTALRGILQQNIAQKTTPRDIRLTLFLVVVGIAVLLGAVAIYRITHPLS